MVAVEGPLHLSRPALRWTSLTKLVATAVLVPKSAQAQNLACLGSDLSKLQSTELTQYQQRYGTWISSSSIHLQFIINSSSDHHQLIISSSLDQTISVEQSFAVLIIGVSTCQKIIIIFIQMYHYNNIILITMYLRAGVKDICVLLS